jgi:VWFA-related protein
VALLSLLALPAVALSQARRERPLSFPVATRLVQVSVVVHKDGAPVADLTREDFELLEDGKPQVIESFSVESERGAAAAEPLPAGTFSNRAAGRLGSVSVILLDRLNTSWSDQGQARDQIVKFLGQIQPEDRIALYVLDSSAVRVLHDFTKDTASLLRALARYRGQTSRELAATEEPVLQTGDADIDAVLRESARIVTAAARRNQAESTALAMEAIANHLAGVPGRKNLIWVSSGFPFVIDDPVAAGSPAGISQRTFADEVRRAQRVVNTANIAIYPVDARGLMGAFVSPPSAMAAMPSVGRAAPRAPPQGLFTTLETTSPALDTMKTLAENTGGRAFYNTNDIGRAIRRAVEDGRLTYVLGFAPSHGTWDGRFRELKVRCEAARCRGASIARATWHCRCARRTARERRGRSRTRPQEPARGDGPGASGHGPADRAQGRAQPGRPGGARSVTLEKKGDAWEGGFALVVAQSSTEGKLFKSFDQNVDLRLTDELRERMLRQGLIVNKKLELRDDAHRVHVLVRDLRSGTTGSLIIPAERVREAAKR